jgi:tetratricopeptide (TPR) repeat protein
MKEISAIVMLTIAMLCASAMAESMSVNQTGISGNISERNPFQDVVQGYDHALQLDPGNASAWLGKAQVSQILGNQIESREYFQKALDATNGTLKDDSQDAKAWQAMGVALAGLARNEEAIGALERSIEISEQRLVENPEDADSWWLKAVSYEALYMDYAAIKAYEKVIELNSTKSVGAWIRIADILFVKANGYNESVEAFNEAIRLMPDNASWAGGVVSDQGNSILRTDVWRDDDMILRVTIGSYNKSTKKFDFIQQIVSRPTSTWLFRDNSIGFLKTSAEFVALAANRMQEKTDGWYKTSQELFQNASYEESVEALNRAIELDPGNSTLHIHKGFFIANMADLSGHKNEGLYEEAIKEFDKALELDPMNEEAWTYKASVLDTRLNKSAEALLAYDKAIELDGENAVDNESLSSAWIGKGTVLAKLGRYNESIDAFDKSIELNPQAAVFGWLSKGEALNRSKRYDEAVKAYDKVVELSPESATILSAHACDSKGDALLAWGKYDEAIKAYDKAIEQCQLDAMKPMGAEAWYKKGIALQALGHTSEADAAFAKAKELGYQA